MGVAADRIQEFDWWQQGKHGDVTLTAAPAHHFSGRTLWDRTKTLWAAWPEESVQAFEDVDARVLYLVHNSTFDLAFHGWRDPLERVAALAERKGLALATPEIGEVLSVGRPRENRKWWSGLR